MPPLPLPLPAHLVAIDNHLVAIVTLASMAVSSMAAVASTSINLEVSSLRKCFFFMENWGELD